VSLSSDILPEFREYERASTTAINASLRPTVQSYLEALAAGLPLRGKNLRITQSGGGTLSVEEAARSAAKLVLSGPAGGVMGAAFVARAANFSDVITYDMGGTSTDVATVLDGWPHGPLLEHDRRPRPSACRSTTSTPSRRRRSIAASTPAAPSASAPLRRANRPGPACYAAAERMPTVTDANLLPAESCLTCSSARWRGLRRSKTRIEPLAGDGQDRASKPLGIVRVAEANATNAVRASPRSARHDPAPDLPSSASAAYAGGFTLAGLP
jgi:N-methylhydantoinase A